MREKKRKKLKKKATLKAIASICILDIAAIIFLMILLHLGKLNQEEQRCTVAFWIGVLPLLDIFFYVIFKNFILREEYSKYEKNYMLSKLYQDKYIEVIPIDTTINYRKFVVNTLPKFAKFYAIIQKNHVRILIKFMNEESKDDIYFFQMIEFENFRKNFKIISKDAVSAEQLLK